MRMALQEFPKKLEIEDLLPVGKLMRKRVTKNGSLKIKAQGTLYDKVLNKPKDP